ncbi:hypothetical protein RRF57_010060 [Xylaria bambusicola]|uniref:Azaphilone pigments biosynthesis cluster protein L N-terminal domain-containing protein n=1 Tax=Xylaria bambusicola TaxID=326684 RepID=A0AAN7UXQ7_9PEZI
MEPLSITTGVVSITAVALQSSRTAYGFVSGLGEAPQSIARSKASLHGTQEALSALLGLLESESHEATNAVLQSIPLKETLEATKGLCDQFTDTIKSYTPHSKEGNFSTRDRFTVAFHESTIVRLSGELARCQRTISIVMNSINLILTTRTANEVGQLTSRFEAQERALLELDSDLHRELSSSASEAHTTSHEDEEVQLTATLRKACQEALSATKAKHEGQTFGNMSIDGESYGMQGIVGKPQNSIDQSFESMTATNKSRAFQGQMDAASFAAMFDR